jgi:CheY-like chemotaxis protein
VVNGTALVVDDEHNIVDLLTDLLEGELGLHVLRAYDGLAALETFARTRPDLVIADIMMPRLDGLALANRLRERDAGQKIILMSAAVLPQTSEFIFIAKPFDIDRMLTLVCDLLGQPLAPPDQSGPPAGGKPGPPAGESGPAAGGDSGPPSTPPPKSGPLDDSGAEPASS